MKKMNVGVALQGDPQNGITLIALIITIIVMLILVGVTINVALNGGLFDKAKTAQEQTQRETDKEQLLSAVIGTLDNNGKVYFGEPNGTTGLDNNLPEGFEGTNGTYTNKNTGKKYKVDSVTGKVTEELGEEDPLEEGYSFTIGDFFNKASEKTNVSGSVSIADFLTLVGAQSLEKLNGYYDENYSFMNFNTDDSSVLKINSPEDAVSSGKYGLGFCYDSEDEVFSVFVLDSSGVLESTRSADKEIIDSFANTYASVKITFQPLGE